MLRWKKSTLIVLTPAIAVMERNRKVLALLESEEKFSKAFQSNPSGIAITDEGIFFGDLSGRRATLKRRTNCIMRGTLAATKASTSAASARNPHFTVESPMRSSVLRAQSRSF